MSNGNEISQPDDHQYAQLLSSSAHHDDGYQSLLPIRGDELRQTSAVILPLDAEADQLMGSAAQNDTDNTQVGNIYRRTRNFGDGFILAIWRFKSESPK